MIKLSQTTKMPCKSWSTLALENCNRGCKLAKLENSICSGCYASKNRYKFSPIVNARREQYNHWLNTKSLDWIDEMTAEITKATKKVKYFRWFDSGDIDSTIMLREIVIIARNLPEVKFWLPTRETGILEEYINDGGTFPSNLTIRVSMDFVDESIARYNGISSPEWTKHVTYSTVITDKARATCKPTDGKCGSCRLCWSNKVQEVSYGLH